MNPSSDIVRPWPADFCVECCVDEVPAPHIDLTTPAEPKVTA